jgi:Zn-dependent protease with chaperone function
MLSFGSMSIVAPVLSTVLHMLPTLSDVIVFEHCHGQDCGPHQPSAVKLSFLGMLLVTAAATALFIVIIFILRKIVSEISIARRNLQVLTQLASSVKPLASQNTFAPAGNYSVIESKDIFAWCAGFVKPKIFVSRGMLERITKKQLSAVLAHEHCHLQQRDNLRKLILHGCTLFWLPWQQKHIRSDFVLSVERYSDFYAKCYLGGIQHRRRQGFSVDDLIHSVVQSLLLIAWVALMTSASHFLIETH